MITNFPSTEVLLEEYNNLVVNEVSVGAFSGNQSQFSSDTSKLFNPYVIIVDGNSILLKQYVKVPQGINVEKSKENALEKVLNDYPNCEEVYYVGTSTATIPDFYRKLDLKTGQPISTKNMDLFKNKTVIYRKDA